jgi:hypothetical protein
MLKSYLLYILRWQLSTPVIAGVLVVLATMDKWAATAVANLVGALMFFWVDRAIFARGPSRPLWEVEPDAVCADCGQRGKGYRVVRSANYDRTSDPSPQFRCPCCSENKCQELRARGVAV